MQVQIVENWSEIAGEWRAWAPDSGTTGHGVADIMVERVEPVGAFPNLLDEARGHILRVLVPLDIVRTMPFQPGARVACRVRRGGPGKVFVHPDHFFLLPK